MDQFKQRIPIKLLESTLDVSISSKLPRPMQLMLWLL